MGWGEKTVNIFVFAQSTGVSPRQKGQSKKLSFCPACAVSLALGPQPEGAVNVAAFGTVRDLVAADPEFSNVAWENLNRTHRLLAQVEADVLQMRA